MGIFKENKSNLADGTTSREAQKDENVVTPPTLARRKMNKNSAIRSGRTIGERRERLETRNERMAARKKDKKKAAWRIVLTLIGFAIISGILIYLCFYLFNAGQSEIDDSDTDVASVANETDLQGPTIQVIDEDSTAGGKITSRMNLYIAQVEQDFRELGYTAIKAVIPTGAIREVDFYLEGYNGFIKTTIDRAAAVSVEDADRMIRYLADQEINDFQYVDVRIDKRAYWK